MFDYNRPAPILLKPIPQRQALLVVLFYPVFISYNIVKYIV